MKHHKPPYITPQLQRELERKSAIAVRMELRDYPWMYLKDTKLAWKIRTLLSDDPESFLEQARHPRWYVPMIKYTVLYGKAATDSRNSHPRKRVAA